MPSSVYKYVVPFEDEPLVAMSQGAKIISVINQREVICVYAVVNPLKDKTVSRKFRVAGTGHPLSLGVGNQKYPFVGTVQFEGGSLVFHVWDMGEV